MITGGKFTFLSDRRHEENERLLQITRQAIVEGSIQAKLINSDDVMLLDRQMCEPLPELLELAGRFRDAFYYYCEQDQDKYGFHGVCCWAFIQGGELGAEAVVPGSTEGQESQKFLLRVNKGIPALRMVLRDCERRVLLKKEYGFFGDGVDGSWQADCIACCFFWVASVGYLFGKKLSK